MDIKSGCGYPASSLSNFAPHPFFIDGIQCNSMEGFLQSLKFKDIEMQKHICTLVGKQAKFKGKSKKWYREQKLYWQGIAYDRSSKQYQELLDRAYNQLATNDSFAKALLATNNAVITHSVGKNNEKETVLTEREFCSRLMKLRSILKEAK